MAFDIRTVHKAFEATGFDWNYLGGDLSYRVTTATHIIDFDFVRPAYQWHCVTLGRTIDGERYGKARLEYVDDMTPADLSDMIRRTVAEIVR
ncbi:hypothetical protein [Bifidobacterium sp. SO1]|uniref:hypothetical protein n=1 Tax=Bifidobacterium sp. SO1 TaxID=2809029 RepID=UPI001BDBD465|nr:hypothetical protein [Bifidobacterium sp. SO1]MBT1162206.1 hypothetical protein [Bifidobacterium sp. SO1]